MIYCIKLLIDNSISGIIKVQQTQSSQYSLVFLYPHSNRTTTPQLPKQTNMFSWLASRSLIPKIGPWIDILTGICVIKFRSRGQTESMRSYPVLLCYFIDLWGIKKKRIHLLQIQSKCFNYERRFTRPMNRNVAT